MERGGSVIKYSGRDVGVADQLCGARFSCEAYLRWMEKCGAVVRDCIFLGDVTVYRVDSC
jgi:hypothetical protein